MFYRLAAIFCILAHGLMPRCTAACPASRVSTSDLLPGYSARPEQPSRLARACCPSKARGCRAACRAPCGANADGVKTALPPAGKSADSQGCRVCVCREPRAPLSPVVPISAPRLHVLEWLPMPALLPTFDLPADHGETEFRAGPGPPELFASHNDRQATFAVWLK